MRALKGLNKIFRLFAVVLILLFGIFTIVPISMVTASEQNLDDYDSFNSSLMSMLMEYDGEESVFQSNEIELQNLDTTDVDEDIIETNIINADEVELGNNRLIVNSSSNVKSMGAVAKAEYKDWHIFQYENAAEASEAFEYFSSLNLSVSYDEVVSVQEVTVESVYTSNPWASYNKTFKSWGASVVGYRNYVDTMFRQSGGNLNDVTVAVLDSGINTAHELFDNGNRIDHVHAKDFTGEENTRTQYAYEDLNGHGSHTSGIIADATLDNVKILPLKVLKSDGKGTVSMIVSALEYVKNLNNSGVKIQVMNMSIGVEARNGEIAKNTALERAVINVYNCGIVPVVSAGNDSMDTSYACPANVEQAFVVSALLKTANADSVLFDSSYSNYGSTIDFSAPGSNIISAGRLSATSYVSLSGTSMAAPHVAASVALICSNPYYNGYGVDDIHRLLRENAVDYGAEGWDQYYGYGCVCIADIGITYSGYVAFSETEEFHDSEFSLSLTYTGDYAAKIYYTTNEYATSVDESSGKLYTGPIKINETTKITAVAYVNGDQSGITQSYVCSQVYYFNNVDLLSNYEFEFSDPFYGYKITKYNGKMTTLNAPSRFNGVRVYGIGAYAFNGSRVQVLNLPSTIFRIDQSAFESNTYLREINCEPSNSIQVGAYAFYKCSNLSKFNLSKISSVGNYAFSYCKNLKSLELYSVGNIGKHALSGSGIETVYMGNSILSIGDHTMLSLKKVYGYAETEAEEFAYNNNIEFVDLTLRFTKDFGKKLIVRENDDFDLQLEYIGRSTFNTVYINGGSVTKTVEQDGFNVKLNVNISGLSVGTHNLYVDVIDAYQRIRSNVLEINVVDDLAETLTVNYNANANFNVYVDGYEISDMELLFKDVKYTLQIVPEAGYVLRGVTINGKNMTDVQPLSYEFNLDKGGSDLEIVVEAVPKDMLSVRFITDGKGEIKIDEDVVVSKDIQREKDLSFRIDAIEGYKVKRVTANKALLIADSDGVYVIRNILSDMIVQVTFVEQFNGVYVTCGKGGSVSTTSELGESDLAYGMSRVFTVSTSAGYVIDFVSVNGERVAFNGNTFEIKNTSENMDEVISVVISFKKANDSVFENSAVFTYFIVILAVFFVLVIAKALLFFARKKNKKNS